MIFEAVLKQLPLSPGQAPDLDPAFEEEAEREAARNLIDLLAAADDAQRCLG